MLALINSRLMVGMCGNVICFHLPTLQVFSCNYPCNACSSWSSLQVAVQALVCPVCWVAVYCGGPFYCRPYSIRTVLFVLGLKQNMIVNNYVQLISILLLPFTLSAVLIADDTAPFGRT